MVAEKNVLVWWTSQADCEKIVDLPPHIPDYIISEFDSRYGRPGRGRLWVNQQFDIRGINWDDAHPVAAKAIDCGGIIIEADDAAFIKDYPGFITDVNLNIVE